MNPSANLITMQPNDQAKLKLGRKIFGRAFDKGDGLDGFREYFDFYGREVSWLNRGVSLKNDQTDRTILKEHDDILVIVDMLRNKPTSKRHGIRADLFQRFNEGDDIGLNRSIDIAMRLWLMINTRESCFGDLSLTKRPCVQWNDIDTLEAFLSSKFPASRWELTSKESRISPFFTAAFMTGVCGLKIRWTDSLEDHLRLDRKENTLWVFGYKRVLAAFLSQPPQMTLLPRRLLEESLQTLDLLFPRDDKKTQILLREHGKAIHDVAPFNDSRTLNLLDYHHWRDRVLELYEEVFLAPPVSWAQLWNDTRNPQQFWTFWIALLILLLTIISTAAGVAQTYASFKGLNP